MSYIDPVKRILATSSDRNPLPDGALIRTATSPIDWTVKALFDSMLAKEKQTRRLGAYERRENHGL
jgi:hypothetical protein